MTGSVSNAAIASLEVSKSLLSSDNLVTFLLHLLPAHQVSVSILQSKSAIISLTINDGTEKLSERNAILRSLCGRSLLNQMDKYPFCLLGGHAESVKAVPESAITIASISSFMSMANSIRRGTSENIIHQLNDLLQDRSFLVGSSCGKPCLADYDVFFALIERNLTSVIANFLNLKRWMIAVQSSVEELLTVKSSTTNNRVQGLPSVNVPNFDYGFADPVPMFYFGDEEDSGAGIAAPKTNSGNDPVVDTKASTPVVGKKELTEEEKKIAAEKRAKKNAEKSKKKTVSETVSKDNAKTSGNDELNISALDIRVGKIIEAWPHESSEKLWCEKIDLGEPEPRQVLSGLREFYSKEEMENHMVLVLCNLKQRNLGGVPSHGMVLCASNSDHTAVEFVIPPEGAKIGERVIFEGLSGDPEPENKVAKKKILEKLAPDLKTDENGVVVWKGVKSMTTAGSCVAVNGMKNAQVS
jgi:aminoacyl tRNA synthase complex-interacting multifunctional protein 1